VVSVLGARTADHVILLEEMQSASSSVVVTTEDGSMGIEGLVTDALITILDAEDVARVFTVGPIPMMQAVADLTRDTAIPTVASLNPIMVDGTGMCGGCRVSVAGTTRFACVDGPEFDAHDVDFPSLVMRNRAYRAFETCQLDLVDEPADG
jgi:ferredoxin--NADP+ reductase